MSPLALIPRDYMYYNLIIKNMDTIFVLYFSRHNQKITKGGLHYA